MSCSHSKKQFVGEDEKECELGDLKPDPVLEVGMGQNFR